MMIDVKEAVNMASKYMSTILGVEALLLEEVELNENDAARPNGTWNLTFSYNDSPDFIYPKRRKYKTVILDALSGQFLAIRIREIS